MNEMEQKIADMLAKNLAENRNFVEEVSRKILRYMGAEFKVPGSVAKASLDYSTQLAVDHFLDGMKKQVEIDVRKSVKDGVARLLSKELGEQVAQIGQEMSRRLTIPLVEEMLPTPKPESDRWMVIYDVDGATRVTWPGTYENCLAFAKALEKNRSEIYLVRVEQDWQKDT